MPMYTHLCLLDGALCYTQSFRGSIWRGLGHLQCEVQGCFECQCSGSRGVKNRKDYNGATHCNLRLGFNYMVTRSYKGERLGVGWIEILSLAGQPLFSDNRLPWKSRAQILGVQPDMSCMDGNLPKMHDSCSRVTHRIYSFSWKLSVMFSSVCS